MRARYAKLDACGNDFLLIEAREIGRDAVRAMCDREEGVGADGVIVLSGFDGSRVLARLFNADGSDGGISGNGARCVAAWMARTGRGVSSIRFGAREVRVRGAGEAFAVEMGEVTFGLRSVEGDPAGAAALEATIGGATEGVCAVAGYGWIGNPHLVVLTAEAPAAHVEALGRLVSGSDVFARGINVHVVRVAGEARVEMATWERGCGRTRACGSGACVVAALLAELGRVERGVTLVAMEGGAVTVQRHAEGGVELEGPVVLVREGEWGG